MSAAKQPPEEMTALLEPFRKEGGEVRLLDVPPEAIEPNAEQPRRAFSAEAHAALADSIRRHGLLQPLVVRRGGEPGRFELVAGERRLRAALEVGLARVPAVVAPIPDDRRLEVALVENLQRCSLNPIEEAEAFRSLMDRYGYTQDSVAERVGRSRSTIANALRLLELPERVREAVTDGRLSAGHARAIAGLSSIAAQEALLERVEKEGLSVRETEAEVQRAKRPRPPARRRAERRPPYLAHIEDRLRRVLGTRVQLVQTGRTRGRIVIDFHSDDEFERLLELFS